MTPLEAAVPGRRAGRTHYGRKASADCPAQPGVARNDGRLNLSHYPDHQAHPDAEAADFPASKCLDQGGTVQQLVESIRLRFAPLKPNRKSEDLDTCGGMVRPAQPGVAERSQ